MKLMQQKFCLITEMEETKQKRAWRVTSQYVCIRDAVYTEVDKSKKAKNRNTEAVHIPFKILSCYIPKSDLSKNLLYAYA